MLWPDLVNGAFELSGSFFIGLSIWRVLKDRAVAGVSWLGFSFFAVWGCWNLFYYPHLGQWWSFAGAVAIVVAEVIYVSLLIYFSRPRRACAARVGVADNN